MTIKARLEEIDKRIKGMPEFKSQFTLDLKYLRNLVEAYRAMAINMTDTKNPALVDAVAESELAKIETKIEKEGK